jgi:ribonuclease D
MDGIIRTTPALAAACAQCRAEGLLALDTEFVWARTYLPRLGLVQFGCRDACWALDCLTGTSPAPLGELLADASTVKILHDAHQDLDHLRHYTRAFPRNVFDTRLAAGFAGFSSTVGLQKLLEETLNVGLPKTETLTDWCRRPLTASQLEYALDDVRYLAALRRDLLARAARLGTAAYLEEELRSFDDPARYADPDPDEVWKRVKGAGRLVARERAALRALAAVRETAAQEWNLPRLWLADDESLVDLAVRPPRTAEDVRFRHRLRNNAQRDALARRYAKALCAALALPDEDCPPRPGRFLPPEVRDAADAALDFLRHRAEEVHIDAALFASRATLTAYLDDPDDGTNPLGAGWRYELAGREIASRFAP